MPHQGCSARRPPVARIALRDRLLGITVFSRLGNEGLRQLVTELNCIVFRRIRGAASFDCADRHCRRMTMHVRQEKVRLEAWGRMTKLVHALNFRPGLGQRIFSPL